MKKEIGFGFIPKFPVDFTSPMRKFEKKNYL